MVFKRAKILTLLFICVFVFYLTSDFTLINIEKTALIISLGIDKLEDDYEVTVQIAIPQGSKNQATNNESVISSKGKTVYSAVSNISELTGWYPKLSFCNLIVLGKSILQENVMNVLDFFVRSYKVEDSAILCASEESAKELLLSSSPLDNISGLSLSKIFVRDYDNASRIMTATIKSFTMGYYSHSKMGYMPIVKTILTDESGKGGKTAPTSTLSEPSSGNGSEGQGGESQKLVIYDANTCLLFQNGKQITSLSGDEALCYSLLNKKVNEAFFTISTINDDANKGNLLISVHKVVNNFYLDFENSQPIFKGNIKAWLRISDCDFAESIDSLSKLGTLNNKILFDAENFIKNNLNNIFQKCKDLNCDLFEIKNLLYKYHPKKFKGNEFSILQNVKCDFTVNCTNFI